MFMFAAPLQSQSDECADFASCEESEETEIVSMFLQRSDLDLSIENSEGKTVLDLVQDRPEIRALLENYIKRQNQVFEYESQMPHLKTASTLKDRGTFFLVMCSLAALGAELLGGLRRPAQPI